MADTGSPATPQWRRSPDCAVVDHGDRVVVLALSEPATARPLVMEGSALAIWHALDEPGTTAEVAARVAADVGIPAAEVWHDVEAFLAVLLDRGLVVMERVRGSADDVDGAGPDA